MSAIIENCKGHVHIFGDGPSGGRSVGFYKMSPSLPETEGAKSIILGIPLALREITQPTVTLDDKRTLYVFGSAWNEASLSGMLLLGQQETKGELLGRLLSWYDSNRVSKLRGPVQLSLGTAAVDAYIVGLRLDAANPKTNTQQFSIVFLTADVKSTGGSN